MKQFIKIFVYSLPSDHTKINFFFFVTDRNRDTVLLVQGLKKIYFKSRKPFVAVDDVNVSVKAGQCFGLLGVNGAGKSTCFQMLTGAVVPSGGDSSIQDVWLSKQKSKVCDMVLKFGCPWFLTNL